MFCSAIIDPNSNEIENKTFCVFFFLMVWFNWRKATLEDSRGVIKVVLKV